LPDVGSAAACRIQCAHHLVHVKVEAFHSWRILFQRPDESHNLRAERDLLRQLVPVISPGRIENGDRDSDDSSQSDPLSLSLHSISPVHDPHPNRLPIPDDYSIEDANADFFD
jgi:hypothetical protein